MKIKTKITRKIINETCNVNVNSRKRQGEKSEKKEQTKKNSVQQVPFEKLSAVGGATAGVGGGNVQAMQSNKILPGIMQELEKKKKVRARILEDKQHWKKMQILPYSIRLKSLECRFPLGIFIFIFIFSFTKTETESKTVKSLSRPLLCTAKRELRQTLFLLLPGRTQANVHT